MQSQIFTGANLAYALPEIIATARNRIRLATFQLSPYTTGTHAAINLIWLAMTQATIRGVKCHAVICDGAKVIPAQAAALKTKEQLQARGWNCRLIGSSKIMHAKCLIIDDHTLVVGSHNWTEGGLLRNHELSILSKDPSACAQAMQWFDSMLMPDP